MAGKHKQELEHETIERTRTGKKLQPTNAGEQHHGGRQHHTLPTRATNRNHGAADASDQETTYKSHHITPQKFEINGQAMLDPD